MKSFILLLACSVGVYAATASPVNISSVTVSSGIATVSCGSSNCNINANYGFCIAGTSDSTNINICSTASTGTGGTSFTFATAASNETLGAAGTVIPARELIFLQENMATAGNIVTVPFLMWLTTTTPVPNSALTSAWATSTQVLPNVPTGGYLKAIQAGTTIEVPMSIQLPVTSFTKADAQSVAQLWFLGAETALINGIQPGQYFGQFCDPVGCSF
jgi:hypothetical protein